MQINMRKLVIITLLLSLYFTVNGQKYALFDTTIQSIPNSVRFNTVYNHNNEFYVVTASDRIYKNKSFHKFDTLGNVIHQKTYADNIVGSYDNIYNTYLWEDTVFYNLTFDNNYDYYLIAYDYDFDTLWKKHIPITDTNLHQYISHTLNISRTADNGFLLSFNVLHNDMIYGMYPRLPLIIRTDGYGNIINYHFGSKSNVLSNFMGRRIAFTQDSCFLTTNAFNESKLLKYNMNAQIVDSLLGVIHADDQIEESFDIIYTDDGKCVVTTSQGTYVNDDLEFKLSISFVDYDNWQKIWTKKIDLGNRDIYPRALLTLNKITNNKYVVSGTYRNNDRKGFHLVFNEQGDILFIRHELHGNQGYSWLSDVVFLDSTHILGIGKAGSPWIFKKEIDLISSVDDEPFNTNDFKLFPNPATEKIYIVPNNNMIDKEVSIEIINSLGKRIIYYSNVKLTNNYSINVNDLGNGVYYLVVNFEGSSTLRKFIIK